MAFAVLLVYTMQQGEMAVILKSFFRIVISLVCKVLPGGVKLPV